MSKKIAFIYPWATFGGIERILLNRLHVLQHRDDLTIDVIFTHDSGAFASLKSSAHTYKNANITIGGFESLLHNDYYAIFCIDFPDAIAYCERNKLYFVAECHTGYTDNRKYLKKLSTTKYCKAVVVPSETFVNTVSSELYDKKIPVFLLKNFVLSDSNVENKGLSILYPSWSRSPLVFFGRLDKLKNIRELIDAFTLLPKNIQDHYFLLIIGPKSLEINVYKLLKDNGLESDAVVLPPIPFNNVNKLVSFLRQYQAIYVSPSITESFGLAAAEMITGSIPVILSNIEAHAVLVKGKENTYLYSLGDAQSLANKICEFHDAYDIKKKNIETLSQLFSPKRFLIEWDILMHQIF